MTPYRFLLQHKRAAHLAAVIILLLAGGLALTRSHTVQGVPPGDAPQPANGDLAMAQSLRAALQNDALGPADRAALQAKLAIAARAAARPTPQVVQNLPPVSLPTVPIPTTPADMTGLAPASAQAQVFEGSEGLVHGWEAAVQNTWQGQSGGASLTVVAGAAADDPTQGWIKVFSSSPPAQQVYLTPAKTGALRIVAVAGTRITFSTPSGAPVYFDLAMRSFD